MTESVVFFSKHYIKCISWSPGQCISHLKCTTLRKCFIQIGHLGLHYIVHCTTIFVSFLIILFYVFQMIIILLRNNNGI